MGQPTLGSLQFTFEFPIIRSKCLEFPFHLQSSLLPQEQAQYGITCVQQPMGLGVRGVLAPMELGALMEPGDLEASEPCHQVAKPQEQRAQAVELGVLMVHGDLEASEPCDQVAKPQEMRAQAVELGVLMELGDLEALEPCDQVAKPQELRAQAVELGVLMEHGDLEVLEP